MLGRARFIVNAGSIYPEFPKNLGFLRLGSQTICRRMCRKQRPQDCDLRWCRPRKLRDPRL